MYSYNNNDNPFNNDGTGREYNYLGKSISLGEEKIINKVDTVEQHQNLQGIPKEWYGTIHIISDDKFFALLDGNEYALYIALKSISYHDSKGQHYLYNDQINFSYLSEELELKGNKNKAGEDAIVSRQSIKKLFNILVIKKVLTKGKYKGKEVYFVMNEKDYKFTPVDNKLLNVLTRTLKGQVIKTFIYLKACYENNLRNGKKETFINRETIARAINEVSKNGNIGKRQLDNISMYITLLYNLNLVIAYQTKPILNDKGNFTSCLVITKVNNSLKDIPIKGARKKHN